MSRLPDISGAECVKALEKIGFAVYRQRGGYIVMVDGHHPHKLPLRTTKS